MTTLFLLRHAATRANLERPYRLQGRRSNPSLAKAGVEQAALTASALATVPLRHIYSSPLRRAVQTARAIATPHRLKVITHEALIECDIGRWERLTWDEIRSGDAAALQRFEKDPARFGYPDGENFAQVARRVEKLINTLLRTHEGEAIAIVSHHVVSRVYLAGLLGLPPALAKRVRLDNCGISVVLRENGETRLATLNATMHLWNCRGSGTR